MMGMCSRDWLRLLLRKKFKRQKGKNKIKIQKMTLLKSTWTSNLVKGKILRVKRKKESPRKEAKKQILRKNRPGELIWKKMTNFSRIVIRSTIIINIFKRRTQI